MASEDSTELKLREKTDCADSERINDSMPVPFSSYYPPLSQTEWNNDAAFPSDTFTFTHAGISAVTTSRGYRPYQEDRAGAFGCGKEFTQEFLSSSLSTKEKLLRKKIAEIAESTKDIKAGTTLTASFMWTEETADTHEKTSHVLTIQIGDSRAAIITPAEVKRLTCEHQLRRKEEFAICVTNRGFSKGQSDGAYLPIIKEDKLMGYYSHHTGHIYNVGSCGLQSTRTLGDASLFTAQNTLFSREPDVSYYSAPTTNTLFLATYSDGITGNISEENLQRILKKSEYSPSKAAEKTVCISHQRGSTDNLSLAIAQLDKIQPGQLFCQFTADGHGGAEAVNHVERELKTQFSAVFDHELIHNKAVFLMNAVLSVKDRSEKTDDKYNLLRRLGDALKVEGLRLIETAHSSTDEEQKARYTIALRNFFSLALQRNYRGLGNTTHSGMEIRRLLNLPEFVALKQMMFPDKKAEDAVQYREIRQFVTGEEDFRKNEKVFLAKHKQTTLSFWSSALEGPAIANCFKSEFTEQLRTQLTARVK